MKNDLDVLFPGKEIEVKGETVKVSPFYFGQIKAASRFSATILRAIVAAGVVAFVKDPDTGAISVQYDPTFPIKIFDILGDASDELMGLVALSINKPVDWLDDPAIGLDVGLDLVMSMFEVNKRFFTEKVLPKVAGLMPLAQAATPTPSDGAQSSSDSSATGTIEPTSTDTPSTK